ncbi:MAG: hypothetical protein E7393_01930 [Ruminococcaceae bacterium]|nr:hypothetical protein [Oscillospiraceae bacterium]
MILLILSAVMYGLNYTLTSYYQKDGHTGKQAFMTFNYLVGLLTALLFFVVNGFQLELSLYSVIMGAIYAIFVTLYRLLGFRIMGKGQTALYTVFLMAGGMMLPYVWGIAFLHEPFSPLGVIGLSLMTVSMIILHYDDKKVSLKMTLMCLAVFCFNGIVGIITKEHQINPLAVSATDFVIVANLILGVAGFALTQFYRDKGHKEKQKIFNCRSFLIIASVAAASGLAYFLQLLGSINIAASAGYPVITGATIVSTTILGWLCLRERVNKRFVFGLILCFVGTCMFI